MKVAIIGTGVSGLVAAHELAPEHDLTVYEASDWVGGHTHTVDVEVGGVPLAVDTGFIVFNERTYPEFCRLMGELGVAWEASDMSFSVRSEKTGLEYNGTNLNGLFAQRRNAVRPSFWRMVRDIMRFYREAPALLDTPEGAGGPGEAEVEDLTLGQFLERGNYSRAFVEQHMIPMGAAIWSARPDRMRDFPMRFLVRFFHNHGFLQVEDRPVWQVIRGGSREYVGPLTKRFRDRIRLSTPVTTVERVGRDGEGRPRSVLVRTAGGQEELYDRVVMATHSDQTLRILGDATPLEREVLGAFGYQENEVVLHTDASIMPRTRRAWASWNYHVTDPPSELPTVTYWMNLLQGIESPEPLFVTLNRGDAIDPSKVLGRWTVHHPIFTTETVAAARRHDEVDGAQGVHYCGAYWRYGFHEDGVRSGLRVAERLQSDARSEVCRV